jgi:RHS repeat-associated protein
LSQTTTPDSQSNQSITNPQIDQANNRFLQSQGYFYDAAGNLTQDASGKRFFYDAENKQTKFYQSENQSDNNPDAIYSYDGGGQRVKKKVENEITIFIYDAAGKMVAEYTINAPTNTNPQISYLTSDMLGSPRILTNASGNVISRRDFMPFGEEIIGLGQRSTELGYNSDNVKQKYTSKERDAESGLDCYWARYYASQHGRFLSTDPLMASAKSTDPQSWNRFIYVVNNPLKYVDPTGMEGTPWDMLTEKEQELIASKLKLDPKLKGKERIEAAKTAFNKMVEYAVDHAVRNPPNDGGTIGDNLLNAGIKNTGPSEVVAAYKSLIYNMGGHNNSDVWKAIDYIGGAWIGKSNGVGIAVYAKEGNFLDVLRKSGSYDVDPDYEDYLWDKHLHSARYQANTSFDVGMHFVQENNDYVKEKRFDVHWDSRSSAFKNPCTTCDYKSVLQERAAAGLYHSKHSVSATYVLKQLQDRGIAPK